MSVPYILLVDDDPDILRILGAAFEDAGHRVRPILDPLEVASLTRAERFDAVVLDVMMPRRSGWEVLEDLRRQSHTERLPVLMLSAIGDVPTRVRGLREGADDFLAKPFHPDEVIARVEGLIGRTATGFQGHLEVMPASGILQMLQDSAASGVLEVAAGAERGELGFAAGRCLSARFAGLAGAEAVVAFLAERSGTFRLRPVALPVPAEPEAELRSLPALILEAAWIEDELRLRSDRLPAVGRRLVAGGEAVPASPEGLPWLPLAEVLACLRARPGTSLAELSAAPIAAPERLALAVAWLAEQGLVTVEGAAPPSGKL